MFSAEANMNKKKGKDHYKNLSKYFWLYFQAKPKIATMRTIP